MEILTKNELYWQIYSVNQQIRQAEQDLRGLEDKLEVLVEFKGKCNAKAETFLSSVQRRKNKLAGINGIIGSMKSAKKYWETMNGALPGSDYTKTKGSIDTIITSVDSEKKKVEQKITDKEFDIGELKGTLQYLQYLYDTYPEEEQNG